jgi:hypothetical protein
MEERTPSPSWPVLSDPLSSNASPLTPADPEDMDLDTYAQDWETFTPTARAVESASRDMRIVRSSWGEEATPMPRRAQRVLFGEEERVLFEEEEPSSPVVAPRPPPPAPFFEVYEDSPQQGALPSTVRSSGGEPLLVHRQTGNIAVEARGFAMNTYNVRRQGKMTKIWQTLEPNVDASGLLNGGRCKLVFAASRENREARHSQLGVIQLKKSDLEAGAPARRGAGSELLQINPVFVTPASQHVTLVMSSVRPTAFTGHFVLELTRTELGGMLVCLAIDPKVLVALLHVDRTEVRFYNIPVTSTLSIAVVLHVSRLRSRPSDGTMLVGLDRVEWYLPEGLGAREEEKEEEGMSRVEAAYLASANVVRAVPKPK